jgi:hypothetical protein
VTTAAAATAPDSAATMATDATLSSSLIVGNGDAVSTGHRKSSKVTSVAASTTAGNQVLSSQREDKSRAPPAKATGLDMTGATAERRESVTCAKTGRASSDRSWAALTAANVAGDSQASHLGTPVTMSSGALSYISSGPRRHYGPLGSGITVRRLSPVTTNAE